MNSSEFDLDYQTKQDKIRSFLQLPLYKRLQWLEEMHRFLHETSSPQQQALRDKLRKEQ